MPVLLPVGDLDLSDTRVHGSFSYSRRDGVEKSGVEGSRDDVVFTERELLSSVGAGDLFRNFFSGEHSKGFGSCHLHSFVNLRRTGVEGTSEEEGEAHHIVNLVGVVRSTSSDDGLRSNFLSNLGTDLRLGVSHSENDWISIHSREPLLLQGSSSRHSDKDIRSLQGFFQSSLRSIVGEHLLEFIHAFRSTLVDDSSSVTDDDILFLNAVVNHKL